VYSGLPGASSDLVARLPSLRDEGSDDFEPPLGLLPVVVFDEDGIVPAVPLGGIAWSEVPDPEAAGFPGLGVLGEDGFEVHDVGDRVEPPEAGYG
jgi:hypothetical protein